MTEVEWKGTTEDGVPFGGIIQDVQTEMKDAKTLFERLANVSFDLGTEVMYISDAATFLANNVWAEQPYGAPLAGPEVDKASLAEAVTAAEIMGQVKAAHHLLQEAAKKLGNSRLGHMHPSKSIMKE